MELLLSPDGGIVTVGSERRALQHWDVTSGRRLFTEYDGHDDSVDSLTYSPDGKTLVSTGGPTLFWDAMTLRSSGVLPGTGRAVSFSSDGKKLARIEDGSLSDKLNTKVKIWDLQSKNVSLVIDVSDSLAAASFSRDGAKLFTLETNPFGLQRRLTHWNLATGKRHKQWLIPPNDSLTHWFSRYWTTSSFLAPNGKRVLEALCDGDVSVYDVEWGEKRVRSGQGKMDSWIITPSQDSRVAASWVSDNPGARGKPTPKNSFFRFIEIATGKEISRVTGHQGKVVAVAWSPNGSLFASGDQCNNAHNEENQHPLPPTICLWDPATGKELAHFGDFQADVTDLTFSPDANSLVAGLRDGTILIFDVAKANRDITRARKLSDEELIACWTDLAGDDAGKAYRGIGVFSSASRQSVSFLRERLIPVATADANKMRQHIADLDSAKFSVRQGAMKHLEEADVQAMAYIQKASAVTASLETRRRLNQLMNKLAGVPSSETVRTIRAIMALERIGSPEARAVLEGLARGAPGARETEEAKASLERLTNRVHTP